MDALSSLRPWRSAIRAGFILAAIHGLLLAIAFSLSESAFSWIVLALSSPGYSLFRALGLEHSPVPVLPFIVLVSAVAGGVLGYVSAVLRQRNRA